jgi:hypothetical protein
MRKGDNKADQFFVVDVCLELLNGDMEVRGAFGCVEITPNGVYLYNDTLEEVKFVPMMNVAQLEIKQRWEEGE